MQNKPKPFLAVQCPKLRSLALSLLFTGFAFQFLISPVFAQRNHGEIFAGVHRDFPPQYSTDEKTGKPAGFAIDTMDEIAKRAGLKLNYIVFNDWPQINGSLKKGHIDIIPNIGVVKDRTTDMDFTIPLETINIRIFVRNTTTDIQSIDSLQGRKVAVVTFNVGLAIIQEYGKAIPVIFRSLDEALLSLLSGNTDALVYPEPAVLLVVRKSKLEEHIKTVGGPLLELKRAIAVGKGKTDLLNTLNKEIKTFIASPEYTKIYAKWYSAPEPYWNARRVLIASGIIIALMTIIFTAWHYLSLIRLNRNLQNSIEKRKEAEEAIREQLHFSQQLLDAIPIPIFYKNYKGVYLGCNAAFQEFVGLTKEQVVGRSVREVFPQDLADIYDKADRDLFRQSGTQVYETSFLHADGSRHDIIFHKALYVGINGRDAGLVGAIMDITDRKHAEQERQRLEERLQRSEKMEALGQLAGGVAHDLNNVLGILSGYSEILLDEIPEGHRSRGHVEKILQSTEKGAAIIQDLLTLARRSVTVSDVTNLNSVVSGFLKTPVFEKMKDYHPRVTFRAEYDNTLLNIKGSSVHLEKALMNLVSNAAESISGKGQVAIRTESCYLDKAIRGYDEIKEGDYAVLTVSDTGMGIPSENVEKIFEPFYTKKTMGRSGTGLGLSIVWGTVKDHNGYIDVQTEVGKGTTFTLYFPVTREELIAQQKKVPIEQYMGKGESVLVVDDMAEQREIATSLLTRLGYEVHAVSSGEEAVEYLNKGNKADILVLDMIMAPGIDGLEAYQRVLEISPKQKTIIVSGFSETDRVREVQGLGAGAYVKKPYAMEKIGMAIRNELDRI